ncbi:hypothetical protein A9179_08865 [Pseudomonas alcaligenes]|uniref:YqjK-like protein n=1 Tax=Aquipseudomonas alcaligenes TaxID=43263 RepID=A0ABR7S0P5_AQUAC|nr:hypothetical protein [Pseudomonas alcaligenes]MBC9250380.1 hypothetical protein [Pseudomonas alcaligenes]
MSPAELPRTCSRRELRRTLIRLRLEMHRQELRHESLLLTRPLRQAQGLARELSTSLQFKHAPLWGIAGAGALAFLLARHGSLGRWASLGSRLYPLLLAALRPIGN